MTVKRTTRNRRISQRAAIKLRQQVRALEAQLRQVADGRSYAELYQGTHIASVAVNDTADAKVMTATLLRHIVIARSDPNTHTLHLYALPILTVP